MTTPQSPSRREQEILDVVVRRKKATAREIWSELGEDRTYSTVRKLLSILEQKGFVDHSREGRAFVYSATESRESAAGSVIDRLVDTFFEGSVSKAVSGLLGQRAEKIDDQELEQIEELIRKAKRH